MWQMHLFYMDTLCNVWDAHMGSVIPMTTTAEPFCYNWFRILKLVALTLPVSAPDLRDSQVASSILTSVVPQVRSPQLPQSAVRGEGPPFCGYCG